MPLPRPLSSNRHWFDRRRIPVLYCPELTVARNESFSPSAGKPRAVVEDWLRHELPIELFTFPPTDRETISLAHQRSYVDAVLDGRECNGFGNTLPEVAATLPYTVGSLLFAAAIAIDRKRHWTAPVACSPTSGFHHAHEWHGAGYCTFNGLIITAMKLHQRGLVRKVGILDADRHYGDGTAALIRLRNLPWIVHWSGGEHCYLREHADEYVGRIGMAFNRMKDCDLIIYQAGADPHIDDPLGGLLTTEQMRERDAVVFDSCAAYGIPLVWNLAGGYQRDAAGSLEPVLALHRNTMEECAKRYLRWNRA